MPIPGGRLLLNNWLLNLEKGLNYGNCGDTTGCFDVSFDGVYHEAIEQNFFDVRAKASSMFSE